MFESGADERNVLPKPVRCIFAAGKRRRRRLHQLFGEWLVVHPQLRLRLRPVRHQVLQRRHTYRHSSLHCELILTGELLLTGEPFLAGEPFLTGEPFLIGELLRISSPASATASASSKARHRRRRRGTRAA